MLLFGVCGVCGVCGVWGGCGVCGTVDVLSLSMHHRPTIQGSGKTYSLGSGAEVEWVGEKEGIIPRALNEIFKALQVRNTLPAFPAVLVDAAEKCNATCLESKSCFAQCHVVPAAT